MCGRQLYSSEDLIGGQDIFISGLLLTQDKKINRWHHTFTRRSYNPEFRVKRNQRRGCVRWVDDVTGAAAKDRVKSVLAYDGTARFAAILQAWKTIAEIPAPRTLANVPSQGANITNLRCCHSLSRFGQYRVLTSN